MAAYLNIETFRDRTVMSDEYVDELERRYPRWLSTQLESFSGWLNSQLGKRYAVPFAEPYPDTAQRWLADIVTFRAYRKRGWDPTDDEAVQSKVDHDNARTEVQQAANAVDGLWDLPRADGASGISKGGPRSYTEASPYVFTNVQSDAGRQEDENREGTFRG